MCGFEKLTSPLTYLQSTRWVSIAVLEAVEFYSTNTYVPDLRKLMYTEAQVLKAVIVAAEVQPEILLRMWIWISMSYVCLGSFHIWLNQTSKRHIFMALLFPTKLLACPEAARELADLGYALHSQLHHHRCGIGRREVVFVVHVLGEEALNHSSTLFGHLPQRLSSSPSPAPSA